MSATLELSLDQTGRLGNGGWGGCHQARRDAIASEAESSVSFSKGAKWVRQGQAETNPPQQSMYGMITYDPEDISKGK